MLCLCEQSAFLQFRGVLLSNKQRFLIKKFSKISVRQSSTSISLDGSRYNKNRLGGLFGAFGTTYPMAQLATKADVEEKTALDPNDFKKFQLKEVQKINHNTSLFRFLLEPDQILGLEVASCIITRAPIGVEGKLETRPYTPTTPRDQKGFFDLVIKSYPQGVMSKHVHSLKPGDYLEIKGPFAKIKYTANMKKKIGMIAGGSGITPMLQVIREVLRNADDETEITLLFANTTEEDILLRETFDKFASEHKNFTVHYVVSQAPNGWTQGIGHIDADMVKKFLPAPSPDSMVFVCGPPPMMNAISGSKAKDKTQGELTGILKTLGYLPDQVYKF